MRPLAPWKLKLLQLLSQVQHLVSAELTFLNVAIIAVTSKAPQVTARGQGTPYWRTGDTETERARAQYG